jgi:catecholate siderophore receptor
VTRTCLLLALLALTAPQPAAFAGATPHVVEPIALAGSVVDPSGGAIPGAMVRLREVSGEQEVVTDEEGRFRFTGVRPPVRLEVSIAGFASANVAVDAPSPNLRVQLKPAGIREQMTIEGGLPVLVQSATKTPTPLRDVPQAVTIVDRQVIEDHRMRGMADVLRFVPGVGVAQGEGNRDTPVFRGNSSTSDFFVDGVRDDVQYVRDLYNVERVEAFKGANAMIFGRGGVGGVLNRVTRQADWTSARDVTVQGGSWDERRVSTDLAHARSRSLAGRLTAMYENSGSYRDGFELERYGLNPTLAAMLGPETVLRAGYEFFHDERVADRGVSSFQGAPLQTDPSTFFGDPSRSPVDATVHSVFTTVEHRFSPEATLRGQVRYADYDKFYQNIFPGAVSADGQRVSLSAYNNGTERQNLFAQVDAVFKARTGPLGHTLLVGAEAGRQVTDNKRLTGYFGAAGTTSVSVPVSDPTTDAPAEFRASATDAENHGTATVSALYVQDQVAIGEHVQLIGGLRFESFGVDFTNLRTSAELTSDDNLVSPRVGLVVKPVPAASLYASYSRSYLPRAGEQLASLSLTNEALEPETFTNYELGAKWDVVPALSLTAAAYRLERGNVAVPDPTNPTVSRLVDAQETKGLELGVQGRPTASWSVFAAYAWQDGEITQSISPTALEGARLAQLPEHSLSLWNRYDVTPTWAGGLGLVYRDEIFASTDNSVTVPSFVRVDAAVFFRLNDHLRGQVNVENVLGEEYYAVAHSNTNITPGAPRGVRVSVTTSF